MKKILSVMLICMAWMCITSATTEGSKKKGDAPEIVFKVKNHDFGTIKEKDGKVTCEFTFTNKGNAPLVIISANAGCGCTTPVFDDKPIPPGKSSSIKVTYNPKGRPGEFVKNVTVKTNDPAHKKVNLMITGTVLPASE